LIDARQPRNFHRLCEIADAENNMPAVQAIRSLAQIGDEANNKQTNAPTPGITINIVSATPAQQQSSPVLPNQQVVELNHNNINQIDD
jgi:hypothetical protein